MSGPHRGSPKPNDDDSWESLAEDLFGIDFHRDEPDDDLDDDDDEFVAPQREPAPAPTGRGIEDEEDLSFDFDDDDEEEPTGRSTPPPRHEEPSRPAPPPEPVAEKPPADRGGESSREDDDFWDALNDWDEDVPAARSDEASWEEVNEDEDDSPRTREKESRSRGGRRRRRRGGRRRQSRDTQDASREKRSSPRSEEDEDFEDVPSPGGMAEDASLNDVDELGWQDEQDDKSDDFGAGLLPGEPGGRPTSERRSRRSRLEDVTPAKPQPSAGEGEDEVSRPPRRRRRGGEARDHGETAAAKNRAFQDVPTWAEAIGMLTHRRPKSTSGWTPDSDVDEPRTSRRSGSGKPSRGNRRRRRRSS